MGGAGTRNRILDAAQTLIQKRGVNAVSFQDLADAVGVRKASVHHYFSTKHEMVAALLVRYLEEFDNRTQGIVSSPGSGLQRLEQYCNLFLLTLQLGADQNSCLCGMLMSELASLDEASILLLRQFLRTNTRQIETLIEEGIRDGSMAAQQTPLDLARLILASLEGSILLARCDGGTQQLEKDIRQLLRLLANP